VLIKTVLESLPVYWMTLAHISLSVLHKLRRLSFFFSGLGLKTSIVTINLDIKTILTNVILDDMFNIQFNFNLDIKIILTNVILDDMFKSDRI
jgi:hypothetical protein